jgi:hypothetical protein
MKNVKGDRTITPLCSMASKAAFPALEIGGKNKVGSNLFSDDPLVDCIQGNGIGKKERDTWFSK